MDEWSIKDKVAIVGIGESTYYKYGGAPVSEFVLAAQAVLNAVEDAGLKPTDIDGFSSYSYDHNNAQRMMAALGVPESRFAGMTWDGGGGMVAAAIGNAAAALVAGYATYVVVYRGIAQGQFGRFGQGRAMGAISGDMAYTAPYGLLSPAQMYAMRTRRFMDQYHVDQSALAAVSLASYAHAQHNPRAVMHGRKLTREDYDNSRWIVEPFHLYDCCLENDGAAAVILTTADRARDLKQKPAYLMAAAQGSDYRGGLYGISLHNAPNYASSNYTTLAPRLYGMAGIEPKDVDVAQMYENFTGGVVMSLVEHGFCAPEEVNEFCTPENLTGPDGKLPLNTSGGNLAEAYIHGMEIVNEAVRQVRGASTCQVKDAKISLVVSGPMTAPTSNLLLHG